MGLCETSNFSIFTFSSASDLKVCTFLQLQFLSHGEVFSRFEWKSLQNNHVTLRHSIIMENIRGIPVGRIARNTLHSFC